MSLKYYGFGASLGEPDASPFCSKLLTWLKITGIEFETGQFDPRRAPKGKAPYIRHEGHLIGDSSLIIDYLSKAYEVDVDKDLTARQIAESRALQSMLEEHLYFVLVYMRWELDEVWPLMKPAVEASMRAGGVPGLMIPFIARSARKGTRKALQGQGLGRHNESEVITVGLDLIQSFEMLLGDGPYVHGEFLSTIDCTAFPLMSSLLSEALPTPLTRAAAGKFPQTRAYVSRMREAFFPELTV